MISRILLMLLLAIFAHTKILAQANCTTPPSCILNFGTNVIGGGSGPQNVDVNTIPGTWVNDWSVFMGTPIFGPGMSGSSGITLVSDVTNGEGMFACYNFLSGKKYDVCFWAYNTTAQTQGELILEAHDGSTSGDIIKNGLFYQGSYKKFQYSFTASQNFNQLRIYTNAAVNSGFPYSVVFDDVQVTEVPVVTASPSTISPCGSTTLAATFSNSSYPGKITWSPSKGLSSTNKNIVTASPCSTTTYYAQYTSTCDGPCINSIPVTVNVQQGSIINNTPTTSCEGPIDLQYDNANPCDPGTTYVWTGPNNVGIKTGPNWIQATSSKSHSGTYTLVVTSPKGCVSTYYTVVKMTDCCNNPPPADFTMVGCNPVRFENNTRDAQGNLVLQGGWHWDFGDGNTSTLRNPSHIYFNQIGIHNVCLTTVLSDQFGNTCCDKKCIDLDVCDHGYCALKVAFDYRIVNLGAGNVQLLDKSASGPYVCMPAGFVWQWTIPGLGTIMTQNPIVNLPSGTHNICLDVYCPDFSCHEHWCEEIVVP